MTATTSDLSTGRYQSSHKPPFRPWKYVRRALFIVILLALTALFFMPFVWLVSASLKPRADVFNNEWIPNPVAWENYVTVWDAAPVLTWLQKSTIVGILAAAAVTISSAAVA